MATFNDILTRIVINFRGYVLIREYVVPFEVRVVALILAGLGQEVSVTREYVVIGQSRPLFLIVLYYFGPGASQFFHKYVAVMGSTLWLFFFWWFAYKFVLEERVMTSAEREAD